MPAEDGRRGGVLAIAAAIALWAGTTAVAVAWESPAPLLAFTLPTALLALRFGAWGGLAGAAFSLALEIATSQIAALDRDPLEAVAGILLLFVAGPLFGYLVERSRRGLEAEREVERLNELLTQLGSELIEAEHRERERIAQELHDGPLQTLLAANQDLIAASAGREGVTQAQKVIDSVINDVRDVVADIHPATVTFGGLRPALEGAAEQAGKAGGFEYLVDIEHYAEGYHDELLLSIGRELLTNAAKHAEASWVTVVVSEVDDEIVMLVADDGVGMPREPLLFTADGHLGLASVTARARAAGGSLHFEEGRRERGTIARAVLPKSTSRFRAR